MDTIKTLCNRVIVLNHGKIVFDGGVDDGITSYLGLLAGRVKNSFSDKDHRPWKRDEFTIKEVNILDKDIPAFYPGENLNGELIATSEIRFTNLRIRFQISNSNGQAIGTCFSSPFTFEKGTNAIRFSIDTTFLTPGRFNFYPLIFETDGFGNQKGIDSAFPGITVDIIDKTDDFNVLKWNSSYWGSIHLPDIIIK